MSHAFAINGARLLFAKDLKAWRGTTLGLLGKASRKPAAGTLYAYSPAVLPKPSDWGLDVLVTGCWFLDRPDWQPDEALESFLKAGLPPVYFGFGSMPGIDPGAMAAGLPTQVIPFLGDQPFWGRRVATLGAGPAPLDRKTLSAAELAKALAAMDSAAMRARAKELGASLAKDRGVETVIKFLERLNSTSS